MPGVAGGIGAQPHTDHGTIGTDAGSARLPRRSAWGVGMQEDEQRATTSPESAGQALAEPNAVAQRAGDADREMTIARLGDAAVAGRLTLDEFSERVERALRARTHDELQALEADLAGIVPAQPADRPRSRWVVTSRLERRGRWQLPPAYRLNVVCGTVVLDLGEAAVEAALTTLQVRNLFGTVTILVPEAVRVEIDDGGVMLTNEVALPEAPPPARAPLIRIQTSGIGGTNYIRAMQPRPVT